MIALKRARAVYEAAVRTRELQQQSLDVEKARHEAGIDTAFFVIQYQAFLSQARSTEVVAKENCFKASTLNNVSVEAAYKGRVR